MEETPPVLWEIKQNKTLEFSMNTLGFQGFSLSAPGKGERQSSFFVYLSTWVSSSTRLAASSLPVLLRR